MQPKLRAVDAQWIEHQGQPGLFLRDRLGLSDQGVIVPGQLVDLLALMDGSRDLPTLRVALELHNGIRLPPGSLEQIIAQMDQTLLLDSPHFAAVYGQAVDAFRSTPYRQPSLAGTGYPADPNALDIALNKFIEQLDGTEHTKSDESQLRGVICPHIDYPRGGMVYVQVWERAKLAVRQAELIIILGTDHNSGDPWPTLTTQNYATPWGTIPTDQDIVATIAKTIGPDKAFANELNHRHEHSIELALVWLHHYAKNTDFTIVPLLCGSFHNFVKDGTAPHDDPTIKAVVQAIRDSAAGRRTLIVAAADLSHVGPAFGDAQPFGEFERATVANADREVIEGICSGKSSAFLRPLSDVKDRYRVCGLSPIYLTLEILGDAKGEAVAYQQCPADSEGGSLVSIAGVLLR